VNRGEITVDERRRAERLSITIPIELRNGSGITRDVSGLGVYFTAQYPFERDEQIEFLLRVPGSIHVRCTGRVVRAEFDRESMQYGVAVTIDDYDVADSDQAETDEAQIVLRELKKHHGS
jgi:hypothetical protein